jgi:hypothetical protein
MDLWIRPVRLLPPALDDADSTEIALFSRTVYLTVLARRSRHHAGARYLTRGANEHGHVANEVESEQMYVYRGFQRRGADSVAYLNLLLLPSARMLEDMVEIKAQSTADIHLLFNIEVVYLSCGIRKSTK